MPAEISIDEEWLRQKYVIERLTIRECAELIGCAHATIRNHLVRAGIERRPQWGSEKTKAKVIAALTGRPCRAETRKRIGDAQRGELNHNYGKRASAETRKKMSESMRGERHHFYGKKFSPEYCEKIRAGKLGKKLGPFSESHRKKIGDANRGPNGGGWRGGISFLPYCPKFNNALKEQTRDDFGRQCYLCGEPENGKRLAIHHTDYNKNTLCNGKTWGLVPLCASCHAKTNHNRWHWFALLNNYWLDKYIPDWIEF